MGAALPPVGQYALRLGDDALVLAQRMGEWVASAPEIEEDVALANIGLDLLGQARALLSYAGRVEAAGRDEDALAYLRTAAQFRNAVLVELPNGDFAFTMARLLAFSAYQNELYRRLSASTDGTLAAIAAKAVKEVHYHRDHATQWVLRLGDGTTESHRRMQAGVAAVWCYVDELFAADDLTAELAGDGVAVDPERLRPAWEAYVHPVLVEATLAVPPAGDPQVQPLDGRRGLHTDALEELLAELQQLHRAHPGASW